MYLLHLNGNPWSKGRIRQYSNQIIEQLYSHTHLFCRQLCRVIYHAIVTGTVTALAILTLCISTALSWEPRKYIVSTKLHRTVANYYISVFLLLAACMGRIYSLTMITSLLIMKLGAQRDMEESTDFEVYHSERSADSEEGGSILTVISTWID